MLVYLNISYFKQVVLKRLMDFVIKGNQYVSSSPVFCFQSYNKFFN